MRRDLSAVWEIAQLWKFPLGKVFFPWWSPGDKQCGQSVIPPPLKLLEEGVVQQAVAPEPLNNSSLSASVTVIISALFSTRLNIEPSLCATCFRPATVAVFTLIYGHSSCAGEPQDALPQPAACTCMSWLCAEIVFFEICPFALFFTFSCAYLIIT